MKCLIWIKKTKRFRDFFHLKCAFWLIFLFLFLYLLAYSYTSFKKKTEPNIFCGKYIFLISHPFYSPPFQYLLYLSLFISPSIFESEWFVTKTLFHRIAFIIYRLPSFGTNIFLYDLSKNLSPEFNGKTIVCCCDLVKLMINQATW